MIASRFAKPFLPCSAPVARSASTTSQDVGRTDVAHGVLDRHVTRVSAAVVIVVPDVPGAPGRHAPPASPADGHTGVNDALQPLAQTLVIGPVPVLERPRHRQQLSGESGATWSGSWPRPRVFVQCTSVHLGIGGLCLSTTRGGLGVLCPALVRPPLIAGILGILGIFGAPLLAIVVLSFGFIRSP